MLEHRHYIVMSKLLWPLDLLAIKNQFLVNKTIKQKVGTYIQCTYVIIKYCRVF